MQPIPPTTNNNISDDPLRPWLSWPQKKFTLAEVLRAREVALGDRRLPHPHEDQFFSDTPS